MPRKDLAHAGVVGGGRKVWRHERRQVQAQRARHARLQRRLIAQLRAADLAVCTGASLESGWLPTLQERAGNARARDVFFASDHVVLIDPQPGAIGTPWAGDVHAEGNPHLHLDPRRLLQVSRALGERLAKELPAERMAIEQRSRAFGTRRGQAPQAGRGRSRREGG